MAQRMVMRKRWAVDRQQLLILLAAAVMLASFLLLVLWPKQQELSELGTAVTRERELVSQKVRASREGVYVSARLSAMRQTQAALDRRLPEDPGIAEFIQTVAECVEAEPGVTHEVERGEANSSGQAPAMPIRLRLTGAADGVHRCMARIESLARLNRFRQVRVRRADDTGRITAEAEVLVYYLPHAAPTAAPAAQQAPKAGGPPSDRVVRG